MRKFLSLSMVILSMFFILMASKVKASDTNINLSVKQDMGIKLRQDQKDPAFLQQAKETIKDNAKKVNFNGHSRVASATTQSSFTYYGGTKYFLGMNLEFISFSLRSVGDKVEVWVADDLSYGYATPADVVTQVQVDMVRDEFESNILPTDSAFFGTPDTHDGTQSLLEAWGYVPQGYYSNNDKYIILVENIKDISYYQDVNVYVAGFYWGAIEEYIDRNIITIDSYAWYAMMPNDNPKWQAYQYDIYGTIAHEFQHLIHDDNDPLEENWINEGMADFAQYLCGYGHSWGHVNAFLEAPENSLLIWGDYDESEILADYGQAYLLQLYLNDHFGQDFIRALAIDDSQGIESMNRVLSQFNTGINFNELFRRFSIAIAIDSYDPFGGIYNFSSIDLKVNYESAALNEKGNIPAWGASYQVINNTDKIDTIKFNGIDYNKSWNTVSDPLGSGDNVLWSNQGNGLDNRLIFNADLTNLSTATLNFDQYLNIEANWDFAFVQISLDNGLTWQTLVNDNMTSDYLNWGEFPQIGNQLPGFTGSSYGYNHEVIDLTPFVGHNVLISFRYMTDGAANGNDGSIPGWFINNISIPELNYDNDCSNVNDFMSYEELMGITVKYSVSFINEKLLPNGETLYRIVNVEEFDVYDEDVLQLRQLFKDGNNYMIIWYAPETNNLDYVPFDYEIINK